MANGRLRTMLAGLHLDLSQRPDRRSASPHHDAATAPSRPRTAGKWLGFLADCLSDLRRNGRRRSPWRVGQRTESCESKILLSGMAPFAVANSYASSAESVGRFWLRKFSELMKQSDLNVFKRLKAIGFSHGQFGFVVEALHNT